MPDLFGKPDPKPREAFPGSYCAGCARFATKLCKKHNERHCASGKSYCNIGFCDACDLGLPAAHPPQHMNELSGNSGQLRGDFGVEVGATQHGPQDGREGVDR